MCASRWLIANLYVIGGGFGGQPNFNPAFFNQQQQGSNDWGNNPHGAKRPRPE